jgi:formylglycine-generating enzyme required for sulfatase activity
MTCAPHQGIIRGGSWVGNEHWATTTTRSWVTAEDSYGHTIGIRLVRDIQ